MRGVHTHLGAWCSSSEEHRVASAGGVESSVCEAKCLGIWVLNSFNTRLLMVMGVMLLLGMAVAPAQAEIRSPAIEIEQKPDGVVVRIDNMHVEHNTLRTRGDRIYIDLPNAVSAQQIRLHRDKTVKAVEIRDGRHPRLSIKMRHGREKTEAIGMAATIENLDGGIVLHIPRWPIRSEVDAVVMVPPEDASSTAVVVESMAVAARTVPENTTVALPPLEAATPIAEGSLRPATSTESLPPEKLGVEAAATIVPRSSDGGISYGLLVGILLLLAGGAVIVWRSRQAPKDGADLDSFRVIATKQLGGKSKVVWLSAGSRDMVVSVGEAGTQLLSEWSRTEQPLLTGGVDPSRILSRGEEKIAPTLIDMNAGLAVGTPLPPPSHANSEIAPTTGYDFRSTLSAAAKAQADIASHLGGPLSQAPRRARASTPVPNRSGEGSPSVAGLLRLRDQAPKVNDAVATEDTEADAEWARELFKATRESVLRRLD